MEETQRDPDPAVESLARLFLEHPAWKKAAKPIREDAASAVYFSHRPGEAWHLIRRGGRSLLKPGAIDDPDLVFRFTPESVQRLERVRGEVADFALELFALIENDDDPAHVDFRVAAPLARLARRGYVRTLLLAGPRVAAFGLARGVYTWRGMKKLVDASRSGDPFPWESTGGGSD